ncbi:hypothetical protein CXB51_024304 [Gossypium anomalum]|uniref:Protein kinase domain-containing protein n=1 Tax=Gossypium anomalum TaxID=47600 RepID=A0A8J5YU84_9ROSI|nr:hypothetical protein CXB51_024304 [Gossypium anomalum]
MGMGFHLALYFILRLLFPFLFPLCPILQAAESQEPACGEEVCGDITIPSPFGIHSTCYAHSWFRVTCNQTLNGEKPFINVNGSDLEVLGSIHSGAILISNPVTYINCDKVSVSVNLSGTPFFFSSEKNVFGSVGCGNLATISSIETDSLGGCIQPRCDDGASESGCLTLITGNFTSYTVNMTAMYPDSNRCASAFIFSLFPLRSAYPLPTGINIGTTHVPAELSWNSTYCGVEGCGNLITIFGNETDNIIGGCLQSSCRSHNKTSFIVGCPGTIPQGLSSFFVNTSNMVDSSDYRRKRSCGFSSLISIDYAFTDDFDYAFTDDFDISNRTHVPTQLQWGIPIYGECHLNDSSDTSCTSNGKYCWSRLSSNHLCMCYRDIDDIGSSSSCEDGKCENYDYGLLCLNAPTKYCWPESCPPQYEYNSTELRCERIIHAGNTRSLKSIIVGCSTSIGTLFLLLATWSMYKVLKRKQKIMLKQKYFKRNGGLLLQQHLSSNEGNVEKIKLFTSKETEKATDHFNENRILGQGGQGTVYKGMLIDGSIVAIKKSKMVEGKKFDGKKVEQFINEVIILSQINHRNVVKLLGCCLEAEVPLLVYEFIPNGTLYDLIHNQNEELPLTWEMRLRIAIEIANALFYLHSANSAPIYHRDIKSSNILLDDKYRAKVSDFGTSRSVALEQTHVTTRVQGTFGYMDPEYFRSSQFTEKSDVYSFGVVLIELLTGQKPISVEQSESVRSLVSYFLQSMQENSLFNILDPMVVKDGPEKEIIVVALLAKRCLNLNGKKRPTMKQVAMELELNKALGGNVIEDHGDEESEIDDIIHSWETNPSCSTSRTITTNSETFPLNSSF